MLPGFRGTESLLASLGGYLPFSSGLRSEPTFTDADNWKRKAAWEHTQCLAPPGVTGRGFALWVSAP